MKNKVFGVLIILLFVLSAHGFGAVRLPRLISNGMVLQRDTEIKIWGWADSSEMVTVEFLGSTYQTVANGKGEWYVTLPQLKAGGPYSMQLQASNTLHIENILIGDVWVCSGQSNMEIPMRRVSWIYEKEVAEADDEMIRQFYVPRNCNFSGPLHDLNSGSWKAANAENIYDFSAVAYFFAKNLYGQYKVPVGLINSALGGSPAEAWISEESLKQFPYHYNELQRFKDKSLIEEIEKNDRIKIQNWYTLIGNNDEGYKNTHKPWYDPSTDITDWKTMKIPGYWADEEPGKINGVIWFGKKAVIPSSMAGKEALLILGRIIDSDSVFVNGVLVGTTGYQYPPRRYIVPAGLLKKGENTIVARVISNSGKGGFVPDKPYEIVCGDDKIDLKGDWHYKVGAIAEPMPPQTFIRGKPAGLFNAMIAPLLNYSIKGVIWYQGESNAERPGEYCKLFSALISDWRKVWEQGDFPFLYVQLPNFMEPRDHPSESNWALLREAQSKALALPNTAMAVAIDVGEWNDIHPLRKKEVGDRLALAARNIAYGEKNIVFSGPVFKSMEIKKGKAILSFEHTGSGLIAKDGGELRHFAIAGTDKKFVWAKAVFKNNTVVVWAPGIKNPVAVRYAWADNPEGVNFFNKEGLPAQPFRTDDWNNEGK
ncbi:MAG: sialate O-acetylesterase [Bacteroidales bacterium]|nr:sialate O-acetylesterase [Bacteroidales bacterium]